MLVRNTYLGAALASCFSDSPTATSPDHAVVLMRGHGFTTQGANIEQCVLRAVYTQQNASIQTTALLTHAAHFSGRDTQTPEIKYLDEEESQASGVMTDWSAYRPWGLWTREVEAHDLYVNQA